LQKRLLIRPPVYACLFCFFGHPYRKDEQKYLPERSFDDLFGFFVYPSKMKAFRLIVSDGPLWDPPGSGKVS
jgi:hypothetical protein